MNELYLLAEQSEVQALFVFSRPVAFKRLLRAVGSFETDRVTAGSLLRSGDLARSKSFLSP